MVTIPLSRLFALVLLLWSSAGLAADIQVKVDRDPVNLDESFHIVFAATEQPDGEPDFSPLRRDFDIRSQGQNSQIAVVNGQYSRQTQWTLTVMAKRAGDLTIPSIAFGKDRSPAQDLRVEAAAEPDTNRPDTSAAGKGELFMEVEAEPKNPYVQAQVLYTVRILSQVGLANARLEDPKLENAVMERVTEDSQYETRRNGQPYRAIERRFAIFPQQSGKITIQPPLLEAEVLGGRGSLFNRFFSQQGGDVARLRGEAIELNVRPIPAQFSGKHWLPAKELAVEEALSKPGTGAEPQQLAAGEPLTRTLKLRALASTVGNLPELASASLPGLRAYPDQPALNEERTPKGLKASREEKVALIPAQAGSYTLPEIAVPWWNTETDREEIARVPARTLTVGAGATAPQPAPPPVAPETATAVPEAAAPVQSPIPAAPAEPAWLWMGLAAFFALGWLLTALAWRLNRRPAAAPATAHSPAEVSTRQRLSRLREACRANDAPAARAALLAWAQTRWPENPPRHLDEVAERGGPELAQEVARLNRASYAMEASPWSGADLLAVLDRLPSGGPSAKSDGLEPLYRAGYRAG